MVNTRSSATTEVPCNALC